MIGAAAERKVELVTSCSSPRAEVTNYNKIFFIK